MKNDTVILGPDFPGLDLQSEAGAPVATNTRREDGVLTGLPQPLTEDSLTGLPRGLDYVVTDGPEPVRLAWVGRSLVTDDGLDATARGGSGDVALSWDGNGFSMPGIGKVKGVQDGNIFWFIDTGV